MRSMTHAMTPAVRSRRVIGSFLFYALLHGLESRSGSLVKTAGGHQEKGRQMVLHRQLIAFLRAQNKKLGGQSVGPHAELVTMVDPSKTWVCRSAGAGRQEAGPSASRRNGARRRTII